MPAGQSGRVPPTLAHWFTPEPGDYPDHIQVVGAETRYETVGQVYPGLPPDFPALAFYAPGKGAEDRSRGLQRTVLHRRRPGVHAFLHSHEACAGGAVLR
jgi:hypothetical protein